jgi:hypothetical protein
MRVKGKKVPSTPVIPELRRQRQEDQEFQVTLSYIASSRPA